MPEKTWTNPDESRLKEILAEKPALAVVGLSPNPNRVSNFVAKYMLDHGYAIIPVNPAANEVMGLKSYPDLASIPGRVDLVNVFRRSEFVPEIAGQAVRMGAKVLWLQEGVRDDHAARKAREAGLTVIQDLCIKKVHQRHLAG